jgi:NAD(P)-dependent dehydrogenase (short-subunit alcohol dehydrogenase family)
MTGLLEGRIALVTGGARGLGRAIVRTLAREGARVAFNYVRSAREADELVAELAERGAEAWAFPVSVLDQVGLKEMVRQIEAQAGVVDVLVNNAGVSQVAPFALLEEADWDLVMDVNVKGAFLTTQAVLRGMVRARRGRILNVSSLAGVKMLPAPVHYCAAKAALKGLTEGLAKEVGRYGITVNCLAPGVLDEGLSADIPPHKLDEYLRHCALGRVGTVAEVAELVAFLASDRNGYMNGATIVVDGAV